MEMEFTVATFNLRNYTAKDGDNAWVLRVDQVAEMIRRTGAWIVGTQEGYFEMLEQLGERLPEYRWVGQGRRGGTQDEFCAILYRHDHLEAEQVGHFWLSETPEAPGSSSWNSSLPRMCTWARLRIREGARPSLHVYNTHLDHVSGEAREQGMRLLCRILRERRRQEGLPAILMGDFNAGEGSPVVRFLREESGLVDAFSALPGRQAHGIGSTFHGFHGGADGDPIDYVFGTEDVAFVATEVRRERIAGRYPSDHYPVMTTLRLA